MTLFDAIMALSGALVAVAMIVFLMGENLPKK